MAGLRDARAHIAFRAGSALADVTESRLKLLTFAVVVACIAGAFEFTIHQLASHADLSPIADATVDASFVALGSLVFTCAWLSAHRARRQRVREEVEKIATLNHEIRNSLEVILAAHYVADRQSAQIILRSVDRIDRALRELFPPPPHPRLHNKPATRDARQGE